MKAKNDTRSAILREAQELVQKQSISGVSFQELAKRIGIKKGSMYYHFETKDDLSVEMLTRVAEELDNGFSKGAALTPKERLGNMLVYYKKHMCNPGMLCPGGAYASEWETLAPPVRNAVKMVISTLEKNVRQILDDGIKNGEFNDRGQTADQLSAWIVASLQGALITSRIHENSRPFESVAETIKNYLLKA